MKLVCLALLLVAFVFALTSQGRSSFLGAAPVNQSQNSVAAHPPRTTRFVTPPTHVLFAVSANGCAHAHFQAACKATPWLDQNLSGYLEWYWTEGPCPITKICAKYVDYFTITGHSPRVHYLRSVLNGPKNNTYQNGWLWVWLENYNCYVVNAWAWEPYPYHTSGRSKQMCPPKYSLKNLQLKNPPVIPPRH